MSACLHHWDWVSVSVDRRIYEVVRCTHCGCAMDANGKHDEPFTPRWGGLCRIAAIRDTEGAKPLTWSRT